MPSREAVTGSSLGHFVSLEGDSNAISEQLRLLPSSPDILIFPTLLDAVRQPANDVPFCAHSFIRHVHEVVSNRVELARSFLQSSSHLQPRLVLANGGCLTARSLCLSMISDRLTNGNVRKAESLFLGILDNGNADLAGKQRRENGRNKSVQDDSGELILDEQQALAPMATYDSNMLHIKKENLKDYGAVQRYSPNENDIEVEGSIDSSTSTGDTTTRTAPSPLMRPSSALSDEKRELAAKRVEDWKNIVGCGRSTDTFGFRSCSHQSSISTFADAMVYLESTDELENLTLSPSWQEKSIPSPSSSKYSDSGGYEIFGSQPAENQEPMKRVGSVSNISTMSPDISNLTPSPLMLRLSSSAHRLGSEEITEADNRVGLNHSATGFLSSTSYAHHSSQLSILSRRGRTSLALTPQVLSKYRNRVCESVASEREKISSHRYKGKRTIQSFEPVFAIAEDLVILFNSSARNDVFEYVVNSYKTGSYPIGLLSYPLDDSLRMSALNFPSPPVFSASSVARSAARSNSNCNVKYQGEVRNADDMGHFVSCESTLSTKRAYLDVVRGTSTAKLSKLALTASSKAQGTTKKFYEVESSNKDSAVDAQNFLRTLLNIPPLMQSTNPLQRQPLLGYPVLPKLTTEVDKCQGNISGPVSRMLALGCEDGVDQYICRKISRQLEKLWRDTAHGNAIHVLDVRDPIINAMQAFTSQSLSFQAGGNPFSQPPLLAKLIVPYLESYRSTVDPRDLLVLQFPESHFPTIIALRELLGSDALQVAGIVAVNAAPQLESPREWNYPVISSSTKTPTRPSDRAAGPSVYSRTRSDQTPRASALVKISFSEADFLLSNTATESEISAFLSNIHNGLTRNYSFYKPNASFNASSSSSITSSASNHSPYTPPSIKRTFFSPKPESLIKISSPSFLNIICPGAAVREIVHQKKILNQDCQSFFWEESEDEDELERIMPRLSALNYAHTNSSKALQWLGLI